MLRVPTQSNTQMILSICVNSYYVINKNDSMTQILEL